jgi:DivIVA domain-containing protein
MVSVANPPPESWCCVAGRSSRATAESVETAPRWRFADAHGGDTSCSEITMTETNGPAATDVQDRGSQPDYLSRYVRRAFRHALRGYNVADVDAHLEQVRGWLTLGGFDRLLTERRDEILGSALREAEATVEHARRDAQTTIEQARLEAQVTIEQSRREAQTILEDATRRAQAATAAAEQRLASLRTLALAIIEETDAQS